MENLPDILAEGDLKKLKDESVFDYTQRVRQAVVENMLSDGIPTKPRELDSLSFYLDAMDRQETVKAKIQLEDEANQSDKKAQELIAGILTLVGNSDPYDAGTNTGRVVEHAGDLAEVQLVPGELDFNQRTLNYDSFISEYREKNPKQTEEEDG